MFIDRITGLLAEKGITRNKMLTDLALSKNSFVNWIERGSVPNGETLLSIARYFNVTTDYILGNTDIKKEPSPEMEEKALALGQYLLDKGIVPDLSDESLSVVMDILIANTDIIKKLVNKDK